MDISFYRDNIKLQLGGDLLELELSDETIDKIVNTALVEIQRYICTPEYLKVPYSSCIDMSTAKDQFGRDIKINSVSKVFRSQGYDTNTSNGSMMDPMQASQWQLLSTNGNLYNFQDYVYNYSAWASLLQIRNTLSTDLAFTYDKVANKLYINLSNGKASYVTIEFIRRYDNVDEIVSDYWIDNLLKLSLAIAKVSIGRIRTRYKQTNALWTDDGDQILQEGLDELNSLREYLRENSQLLYPID